MYCKHITYQWIIMVIAYGQRLNSSLHSPSILLHVVNGHKGFTEIKQQKLLNFNWKAFVLFCHCNGSLKINKHVHRAKLEKKIWNFYVWEPNNQTLPIYWMKRIILC